MPDNKSAAVDVAEILAATVNPFTLSPQSIGTIGSTAAWGIYINQEPSKPTNSITIFDTGGLPPIPCQAGGVDNEYGEPVVQIRVRSSDFKSAYDRIMKCYEAIQNQGGYQTDVFYYSGFFCQGEPISIGEDSNNRGDLVVNFKCARARSTLFPTGASGIYALAGDYVNSVAGGTPATNVGGSFVADAIRGTVWQGSGLGDRIDDVVDNVAGSGWSLTMWVNSNDITFQDQFILGSSVAASIAWLEENSDIVFRIGTNKTFVFDALSINTWYNIGFGLRQDGADVKVRVYIDGTESTTGELTITGVTIPKIDSLGGNPLLAGTEWNGEIGKTNVWPRLLSPAEFGHVNDIEKLP